MKPNVLILGGGYAGQLAANRLAKRADANITVIDPSETFTERIRLHQVAAGEALQRIPMTRLLRRGVRFRQGRAVGLHTGTRRVVIESNHQLEELQYDYLVLATGSRIDLERVPGAREYAHALNSRSAAEAIARFTSGRIAIVGGGLTGIEAATELAESHPGAQVTLLSATPPGSDLSEAGEGHVRTVFDRLGIRSVIVRVTRVEEARLVFADGTTHEFDLCLWSTGFLANELARASGLPVNHLGQVRVMPTLQAPGHPEIFVAGDAAETFAIDGRPIRMGCVSAEPMGVHAGAQVARSINGQNPEPFDFAYQIQCISLGRRNGLIQFVDPADRPLARVIAGRVAAWIKELVCRYTVWSIAWERSLPFPTYFWAKAGKQAALRAAQV